MRTLIIGGGEIGRSLFLVFAKSGKKPHLYDLDESKCIGDLEEKYDILHICIPYNPHFVEQVEEYKRRFEPEFVVIHSTVPIGTSRRLNAFHSPVVGIHPNLSESITTFTKFLSGPGASEIADHFRRVGIKVYLVDKQESTEYMKIMSTTFYAMMIEFHKEVKNDCKELDIPFELFTLWNLNYNQGYEKIGYPEYKKPILTPIMKRQGGHCTLPNSYLIDNDFTKLIKERNK
jgi:hypothetical protein